MPSYPSVEESRDRLQRAGWSLGETRLGQRWQVDGREVLAREPGVAAGIVLDSGQMPTENSGL
jgi:hypothetical protein